MADLQVFDMNPSLNFPIADKSIYQMNFNSTATHPPVTNYVTESNPLTNHLQLFDLLNPQTPSGSDDKKRQFFSSLMASHYIKQEEIERKIDVLTDTMKQFIQSQEEFNKLIAEQCMAQNLLRGNIASPITAEIITENNHRIEDQEAPSSQNEEIEEKIEREIGEQSETVAVQQTINNPMPVYPVPISHDASLHSPIRNRSISPEKMETDSGEMSVRDFLKTTMTVQKADEKILEEELERDRDEAAQAVRYNKFRVRNRPKKYKRSAVTFSSTLDVMAQSSQGQPPERPTSSTLSTVGNPSEAPQLLEQIEQSQSNSIEIEDNVFQPIVVPCVQRASELDLTLMQPVFSTTSSYVLNSALDPSSHATHSGLSALTDPKFQPDPNNLWKAVDGVTQLLVDAPSLLESDLRSFADHSHPSSFLPFVGTHEPLHRSAFVPAQYHKDRRIHQQMDPSITDSLRNL